MPIDVDHVAGQVLENCAISDAQHAGAFSICGLALRLRNLFKWERGLDPWVERESGEVLDWIGHQEERWEQVAERDFSMITLSGEIHDKGIYILHGFLQSKYARDFPLSVRASICFEQSYVEVDGDSASSAEVYALLSAIGNLPMRQDIAVTGSVNQMGQIQPVGGISEKIEGFYDICSRTGLTGNQGVIIPEQNVSGLILRKDVQEALSDGRFSIYTVASIDDGIEILTGRKAGHRTPKGAFESGSVNAEIERRLHEMALTVKNFGGN